MITKEQLQRLNPEMAAIWVVGQSPRISNLQHAALVIACRDGGVVVAGTGQHDGHVEYVHASTIRALARRGFLVAKLSSDGGYAGQLSAIALDRLSQAVKS